MSQKFVEEQPQIPFDYAQGTLSAPFGQTEPNCAQDDETFVMRTSDSEHWQPAVWPGGPIDNSPGWTLRSRERREREPWD